MEQGCLEALVNVLEKEEEERVLRKALKGIENILETGQAMMTHDMQNP